MTATSFFDEMSGPLVGYFQRHGGGGHSEDLARECLTRVLESCSKSGDFTRFTPQFAYGVAKNVLLEFLRDQNRVYQLDPEGPEPVDSHTEMPNPEAGNPILTRLIREEEQKRFEACYTRPKPKDRQLWDEYYDRNSEQRKTLASDLRLSAVPHVPHSLHR